VVLRDVDSRCQLRRHLAQLCADDVVLFHNTHTHIHTHAHIHACINQHPALHLKHLLQLNFACTAPAVFIDYPSRCSAEKSIAVHYTRLPRYEGPIKTTKCATKQKKIVISHLHHPVVSGIVHLGNTLHELPEP
jgi:hypothetical protein